MSCIARRGRETRGSPETDDRYCADMHDRNRRAGPLLPICAILLCVLALDACGARQPRPVRAGHAQPGRTAGCPGTEAGSCPYRSVSFYGQRGEGVLRFPEALAVTRGGEVLVADQYS